MWKTPYNNIDINTNNNKYLGILEAGTNEQTEIKIQSKKVQESFLKWNSAGEISSRK